MKKYAVTSKNFSNNVQKTKQVAVKLSYMPKEWFKKQEKRNADGASRKLNRSDILAITIMAIAAVITNLTTKLMTFKRWSLLQPEDFHIYHPWSPYIYLIGSIFYIGALWIKGVKFWLAYFPAILGITFVLLRLALINKIITPQDLAAFTSLFPDWFGGI